MRSQITEIIRAYSKNNSSDVLNKDEFVEFVNDLLTTINHPALTQEQMKSLFCMIDGDGSGTISAEELEAITIENKIK